MALHAVNTPTPMRVLMLEHMEPAVANKEDNYNILGPYEPDTPDTELVTLRYLQVVSTPHLSCSTQMASRPGRHIVS